MAQFLEEVLILEKLVSIPQGDKMDANRNGGITLTIKESRLQVSGKDGSKGIREISSPKLRSR